MSQNLIIQLSWPALWTECIFTKTIVHNCLCKYFLFYFSATESLRKKWKLFLNLFWEFRSLSSLHSFQLVFQLFCQVCFCLKIIFDNPDISSFLPGICSRLFRWTSFVSWYFLNHHPTKKFTTFYNHRWISLRTVGFLEGLAGLMNMSILTPMAALGSKR